MLTLNMDNEKTESKINAVNKFLMLTEDIVFWKLKTQFINIKCQMSLRKVDATSKANFNLPVEI